jgi:CHAT domain-containing protein
MGAEFTDTSVISADLTNTRVLHFASHGLLPISEECLPEPALVTSLGGPGSDGLLEASEIVALALNADFVVLSACDTGGRGATSTIGTGLRAPGGEALSGLVRAFFYAGARNVVASHWLVPDEETITLMETLYSEFANGKTLSEAMHVANSTLAMRPATSHPFYWAAFSVIGDGARSTKFVSTAVN